MSVLLGIIYLCGIFVILKGMLEVFMYFCVFLGGSIKLISLNLLVVGFNDSIDGFFYNFFIFGGFIFLIIVLLWCY